MASLRSGCAMADSDTSCAEPSSDEAEDFSLSQSPSLSARQGGGDGERIQDLFASESEDFDADADADELLRCLSEIDRNDVVEGRGPAWMPVEDEPVLVRPPHCRRDTIVCIVSMKTPSTFCFAVISRLGRVGVYDSKFALLDSYSLELGFVPPKAKIGIGIEGDVREPRQRSTWVNDAIFLPDCQMLVVAASDRSLTILDASRLLHCRRSAVRSLPASPRCLAYAAWDREEPGSPSRLFIGDDCGGVTTITFKRPKKSLLKPPDAEDKRTSFFWSELQGSGQGEWVSVQEDHRVHGEAVSRLFYSEHNDSLVSCSRDPRATLVIRHLAGRRAPCVFSIPRGASCFLLDWTLHLLVTGGRDAVVRVWNPLAPSPSPAQPQAELRGHKAPVVDVALAAFQMESKRERESEWTGAVLSLDLLGVLRVWHAMEHSCLQVVVLPFTSVGVPGRRVECGARALYPGPAGGRPDSSSSVVFVTALCGELVTVRVTPPPGTRGAGAGPGGDLEDFDGDLDWVGVHPPPRRDPSPAVPDSWSPSLLEPSSGSRSSDSSRHARAKRTTRASHNARSLTPSERSDGEDTNSSGGSLRMEPVEAVGNLEDADVEDADDLEGALEGDPDLPLVLPKSQSPLPESIEDWPVPDDRLFKEEPVADSSLPLRQGAQGAQGSPTNPGPGPGRSASAAASAQPVSHRPVPDENGLYPEEMASLRALGLRPLDLESIGLSLGSRPARPPSTGSGSGVIPLPLPLLQLDALSAVRRAQADQKDSHKQMRTLAWHCAPHLALKLPQETPLSFSRPLPVTARMRARGIDVSDPERLLHAKLGRLTAAQPRRQREAGAGVGAGAGAAPGSANSSTRHSSSASRTGSVHT